MEMSAVFNQDRVQKLVETLTDFLSELDKADAVVAAAHVDSALHALRRQFELTSNTSNPD